MKVAFILIFLAVSSCSFSQNAVRLCLKKGKWIAEFKLSNDDVLPFNMLVDKKGKHFDFSVVNGNEIIHLDSFLVVNDSVHLMFPFFNSELVFRVNNKKSTSGYWQNFNKGKDYKIPFTSQRKKTSRFSDAKKKTNGINVNGKWEVVFGSNTTSAYPAVGIFEQEEGSSKVTGTFLTETGDYRFLAGNSIGDSIYLSCFDGSHAFLFKALNTGGELKGEFFSGTHWHSEWEAVRNETIELTSPDDLTYLKDSSTINFDLKNLDGSSFSFPNSETKNKVVIIQIMGTWCPNCLDETIFYKNLYEKYHDQGLEIISIGYETGDTFEQHSANILRLKNKLGLDFTFLVGGNARKDLASEHFNMLNKIISFPTSIYIGRDGKVKRIHTGFNGPGTGDYYTDYVQATNALIEYLLAH
ncbi:MAG: TlpA family protein disulfide reductase [Crocinitomicaceae bacterium]|nr:TlpA family protein disulfide reductase [Crocinitomicaceae bacterium]